MRAKDLQRSARGVVMLPSRSNDTSTLEYRCRTLLPILNEHQIFSRRTAAQLWGVTVAGTTSRAGRDRVPASITCAAST
ncbi:hypothetical protein K8P10_001161 [Leucobacter sp. Psy1]|nr:hypothetical protein K8P10_001161 [Leucobacter sp. Psy1]